MTPEDKQLIAEYMGWCNHIFNIDLKCRFCGEDLYCETRHLFDSNDASLCVQKMVEKGDWEVSHDYTREIWWNLPEYKGAIFYLHNHKFTLWLFNPDNFFSAMASWLRSK